MLPPRQHGPQQEESNQRACRSTRASQLSESFPEMKQSAGKLLASINSGSVTDFGRCSIGAIIVPLLHVAWVSIPCALLTLTSRETVNDS